MSNCQKLNDLIESHDIFSKPVELNVDDLHKVQKSTIGGIFSILLIIYMFFFIIMNMKKIKNVGDSDIKNFHGRVDLSKQDPLPLNETNLQIMYSIKKQSVETKIPLDTLSRYLNLSFLQVEEDWHDFKYKDRHYRSFGVRECALEDFGGDEHARMRFRVWQHRNLFCPDSGQDSPLVMQNHDMDSFNKNIVFRVSRCQNYS